MHKNSMEDNSIKMIASINKNNNFIVLLKNLN